MHMVAFNPADLARANHARRTFVQNGVAAEELAASSPEVGMYFMSILHAERGQVFYLTLEKWETGRGWFGPKVRWRLAVRLEDVSGNVLRQGYVVEKSQPQMWSHFLASFGPIARGTAILLDEDGSQRALAAA